MFKPTLFSICILLPLAIAQQARQCKPGNNGFECPEENCRNGKPLEIEGEKLKCCTVPNPMKFEPTCKVDTDGLHGSIIGASRGLGADGLDGPNKDYDKDPIEKPLKNEMKNKANAVIKALDGVVENAELGTVSNKINEVKSVSRSIDFNFGPFGLGASFSGGAHFPKCPVHVKMCYRVQCGPPSNNYSPKDCLSDPRCCYDFKLAFMRRFIPQIFGDVPVCYCGPTSTQWVYVTNFFKPWNPWYTDFILKVFKPFFNTKHLKIGGKSICDFHMQKKAYPAGAKSKLQCNLVGGCWDDNLQKGSKCFMPGPIARKFFRQNEVYHFLFTNNPQEEQCSYDWFTFGPKAYDRLPCGIGPPPDSIWNMIFDWCPSTDCCINYAGLGAGKTRDLTALGMILGQGSNPSGGQTPLDPKIFAYLLGGKKTDLTKLYCPYRNFFSSSLFPDFKDDIEGCCDIPLCYHKKKYVGGGVRSYPPSTRQPPPLSPSYTPSTQQLHPPQHPQGVWGAWSSCNAQCGRYGTRTGVCLLHGQPTSSNYCAGPSTERCLGYCPSTSPPPPPPSPQGYTWSEERLLEACSVTCGTGFEVWGRQCLRSSFQVVDDYFCQGTPQKQEKKCYKHQCPNRAQWTWVEIAPCGAACGSRGVQIEARKCKYHDGRDARPNECPPDAQGYRDTKITPCNAAPCSREYYWSGWRADCQHCANQKFARMYRSCYEWRENNLVLVNPQSLCGPPSSLEIQVPCASL